jgi:hypothetical protein
MTRRTRALAVAPAPVAEPKPIKTPEVMADESLEAVLFECEYTIAHGKETSEKFAANFLKNPAHALEWSREIFVWAGRHAVAGWIRDGVNYMRSNCDDYTTRTSKQILSTLVGELRRDVLRDARSTSCSTSPTSNYMATCLTAARAEMLERMERSLAFIDGVE